MLNTLFGSAARAKLLNYFMLYPDKSQTLPLLARELETSSTTLRKELSNLISFGLVLEEKKSSGQKADKKYYRVNPVFILYPEIKALVIKAQILSSERFIKGLDGVGQIKFLALTGLFTNYPEAQTDLLLVGKIRRPMFLKLLKELETNLGREVNYTLLSEAEFNYRRDVMDIFLYNILEGKTIVLRDSLLTNKSL